MFICVYSGERLEKSNDTWSFREPSRVLNQLGKQIDDTLESVATAYIRMARLTICPNGTFTACFVGRLPSDKCVQGNTSESLVSRPLVSVSVEVQSSSQRRIPRQVVLIQFPLKPLISSDLNQREHDGENLLPQFQTYDRGPSGSRKSHLLNSISIVHCWCPWVHNDINPRILWPPIVSFPWDTVRQAVII